MACLGFFSPRTLGETGADPPSIPYYGVLNSIDFGGAFYLFELRALLSHFAQPFRVSTVRVGITSASDTDGLDMPSYAADGMELGSLLSALNAGATHA